MTYTETLNYLFTSLPMYHRIGQAAYKADITNTVSLMEHLGHPERKFQSIHVAGTNGKGSVSHMLASILQQAGYKVGLYTSPHLVDFRERIRICGEMNPEEAVTAFVEQHKTFMEGLQLSFFEMTVGMAFDFFAHEQVDVAVVEVGMGGRLDSTNVITPLLSVITNIGLEHTQFLGDTLAKIAAEKAGIIKEGVPVVIGQYQEETMPVFEAKATTCHAPLTVASQHWRVSPTWKFDVSLMPFSLEHDGEYADDYLCGLTGSYQMWNIATVCEAVHQLRTRKLFIIKEEDFRAGLEHVIDNTHLQGRWQIIGREPLTICETAHNYDGINAMMLGLVGIQFQKMHIIYGCVNDKDYRKILSYLHSQLNAAHLGKEPIWYFSQPSVPRGLPAAELAEAAHELGIEGNAYPTVAQAIADACKAASPEDLILITGSIFLVADTLSLQQ